MVSSSATPERRVRKREKYAAGMILENSSLRRHLQDAEAEPLIRWALARLTAAAQRTANLPDDDAYTLLEQRVEQIGVVMRLINQYMAALRAPENAEAYDGPPWVEALRQGLAQLSPTGLDEQTAAALTAFWQSAPPDSSEAAYHNLLSIIERPETE